MKEENVVTVTMFGKFTISYQGTKVSERVAPVENQSWQLLKYMLANAGRVITTEEIIQELGLEVRATAAMNTLRVRLSRSRDILEGLGLGSTREGLIMYGDGQFWVNTDYHIETDQKKIDRCYISMSHQKAPSGEELREYIEGLVCFSGNYLEHSKSAPWVSKARAHYDKVYLQLLDCCMEGMANTGDYSRADIVWNSALRLKPWEFDLHERLLRGFLRQNRIAEAATYYARLAVQFASAGHEVPAFDYFMN